MAGPVAITREVSPAFAACELTHLERVAIDPDRARAQHLAYTRTLADAGYRVEQLASGEDMADAVFIEDIAVVFDELAVVTRPGAASRRVEVPAVADALTRYRTIARIEAPATVDGGDVLVVGKRVFIGRSTRTNGDAVAQLRRILTPYGYGVCEVSVRECLHLKSAATRIDEAAVLLNPHWVAAETFRGLEVVAVDPGEPSAANALRLRDRVVVAEAFPRTAARLASRGLEVVTIDASEFAKAEGAITCCSLIVESF